MKEDKKSCIEILGKKVKFEEIFSDQFQDLTLAFQTFKFRENLNLSNSEFA